MKKNMALLLFVFCIGLLSSSSVECGGCNSKKISSQKCNERTSEDLADWSVAIKYDEVTKASGAPISSKRLAEARKIRDSNLSKSRRYLIEDGSESEGD